jgi:hypothetical protein
VAAIAKDERETADEGDEIEIARIDDSNANIRYSPRVQFERDGNSTANLRFSCVSCAMIYR